jgi:chromosome partitioning protein
MKLFRKRRVSRNGGIDAKRLGIFEEVYGSDGVEQIRAMADNPPSSRTSTPATEDDAASSESAYFGAASERKAADVGEAAADAAQIKAPASDSSTDDSSTDELPIARPNVLALANTKGGSGKSTTAIHLALGLLDRGYSVGTIDLDGEQGTLTHMLDNRRAFAEAEGLDLPMPEYVTLKPSVAETREDCIIEERCAVTEALQAFADLDFVVIDAPGHHGNMTRLALAAAGTLISPVNDSFLDLDALAQIDPRTGHPGEVGAFTRMVREERARRTGSALPRLDWVVVRNRLSSLMARNKQEVADTLERLTRDLDFRLAQGFGERVIFREFFAKGLTLLDLQGRDLGVEWTLSHVAAREELRQLLETLTLGNGGQGEQDACDGHTNDVGESMAQQEGPEMRSRAPRQPSKETDRGTVCAA